MLGGRIGDLDCKRYLFFSSNISNFIFLLIRFRIALLILCLKFCMFQWDLKFCVF